ncbi:MAG: hypothetical protein ACREQY_08090 [Candidatus Binatia bacterium]
MTWPLRLRAKSFLLTLALSFLEALIVTVPLGLVAWLAGASSPSRITKTAAAAGAAWSLAVSVYTHYRPPASPTRGSGEGGGR